MLKSILLVEDDTDVRESLAYLLSDQGYDVACAEDGQEALTYLQEGHKPALILLDLMMPRMNGFEFRAKQRQEPDLATIPVIVLSASGNVSARTRGLDAAVALEKPIAFEKLCQAIEQVC
ncbi:MAG TPA: response regulator [Polyangiaceae bacterium]|jgi:CheY-like chemotaxis protein|nr:response regulator [Polyangiaceae bacterium]